MSDDELAQWHRKKTRPNEKLTQDLGGKVVAAVRMDRPDGNEEEVVLEFTDGTTFILEARSGPYLFNRVCGGA